MSDGTSTVDEPIVINTSPLLALAACAQLELLHSLHRRVVVPQVVIAELERGQAAAKPLGLKAEHPDWLEVTALASPPSPLLTAYLDAGEAAVIALALEQGIRRVVIDERRAHGGANDEVGSRGQHRHPATRET